MYHFNFKNYRKSIKIDKLLFCNLEETNMTHDEENYCIMTIVILNRHVNNFCQKDEHKIWITPEILLMSLFNKREYNLKPKNTKGFIKALNQLQSMGLIKLDTTEIKKMNQLVEIDVSEIVHHDKEPFFLVSDKEIRTIMQGSTPHHLMTIFCNMASRWSMESYRMYDENGWNKHEDRYYDTNLQMYKYLSCYPTQRELRHTWCSRPNAKGEKGFNCIARKEWVVSRNNFTGYINELIELKLISRITKNHVITNNNFYCRPQHAKCIDEVVDILTEQGNYAKDKRE